MSRMRETGARRISWGGQGVLAVLAAIGIFVTYNSRERGLPIEDRPRSAAAQARDAQEPGTPGVPRGVAPRRVLLELIPSGPAPLASSRKDRDKLKEVLILPDEPLCDAPPMPGRSTHTKAQVFSAVLNGDHEFKDLDLAIKNFCRSSDSQADDGLCRVVAAFADPSLMTSKPRPGPGPEEYGSSQDVMKYWRNAGLRTQYGMGEGVWLAIVDRGFSKATVRQWLKGMPITLDTANSYVMPNSGLPANAGEAPVQHGTMVAYDAMLAGFRSTLLDIRIQLDSDLSSISGAACGFSHLADVLGKDPGHPMVVVNSWAMKNPELPAPPSPPPFLPGLTCAPLFAPLVTPIVATNPCHTYNRTLTRLVEAGADVVFAAGNDGSTLGSTGRCGSGTVGTIRGINSHPLVLTVGAVNLGGTPLLHSSVGPGELYKPKPDLATFSGFSGSNVYETDNGTSAAAAVAGGVLAALRSKSPTLSPADLKTRLRDAAAPPPFPDLACRMGAGVMQVPKPPPPAPPTSYSPWKARQDAERAIPCLRRNIVSLRRRTDASCSTGPRLQPRARPSQGGPSSVSCRSGGQR
jgi:hypothetical protein